MKSTRLPYVFLFSATFLQLSFSKSTNYVTVHRVPIDVYSLTSVFLSVIIAAVVVRYVYWFSEELSDKSCLSKCMKNWRSTYQSAQTRIAVNGIKTLKFFTLFPMILSIPMLRTVDLVITGNFFAVEAVNKGLWVIFRFVLAILVTTNAYLFDAHQGFRAFSVFFLFLAASLDLGSQLAWGSEMYCMGRQMCVLAPGYTFEEYDWFFWRDFISGTLNLVVAAIAMWLWFLFGIFTNNTIFLPKKEHREITKGVDKLGLRVRNAKSIVKPLTEGPYLNYLNI